LILLNGEEYQGNSYAGRMTVYGPGILENYGQQVIFLILPADGKDLLYQRAEYLGNRYCYDFENDMHNLRKWKAHLDHIKWEKNTQGTLEYGNVGGSVISLLTIGGLVLFNNSSAFLFFSIK